MSKPNADTLKKAEAAKDAGNKAFTAKNFAQAAAKFSEAIALDGSNSAYFSNRSAAYTKLGSYDLAIEDGQMCVHLAPEWGKGYLRLGAAFFAKGDFAKAVATYAQGLSHEPDNESLTDGLQAAQKKIANKKKKKSDEVAPKIVSEKKKEKKESDKESDKKTQQKPGKHDIVIGIDLGTTYSCVGVWEDDTVKIIPNSHGDRTTPSYVSFKKSGEAIVGMPAKTMATQRPRFTIFDVKRIIGQRFSDPGVAADIRRFPFTVVKGQDDKPMIQVDVDSDKKLYAPEEISALVLQDLKQTAEAYLGHPVTKAVITVPAYFNDSQRNATKAAGAIAGLEVLRIINEPTAAALSYGLDNIAKEKEGATNVCIFDLGGGTFDVSVLSIEGGVFTVKATGGDTRLGGEDFDNKTVDYLLEEIEKQGFKDLKDNLKALRRVRNAAEKAKRELSQSQATDVILENLVEERSFSTVLTRQKLESMNLGLFNLCIDTVKRVLKDAKMQTKDIHEIVLVGGSTRIPRIQEMLSEFFNGRSLNKSVNPDEAVAFGAAVQGAILSGRRNKKTDDVLLMDVTPLSLGIETTGKVMSVIIPRNTPIPCIKTQVYTTETNYQAQVDIPIYEGERMQTDFNHLLGEFTITGIERAKKHEPQIEVTFSIDSNGILDVKAKDKKTGAEANIQIANRGKSSDEEIKKMVEDAEKFRKLDQQRVKRVEARNQLEALVIEALEVAESLEKKQAKLAAIIRAAAEKDQDFVDTINDTTEVSEITKRISALEKRIQGKGGEK